MAVVVGHTSAGEPIVRPNGEHVVIIGPPGSGKTSGFLVPSVVSHEGPVVVTSSRDDVIQLAAGPRTSGGGRIFVFALGMPQRRGTTAVSWDPTQGCEDYGRALLRAEAMVQTAERVSEGRRGESFWLSHAARLLATTLYAAALGRQRGDHLTVCDIADWLALGDLKPTIELLEAAGSGADRARRIVEGIDSADLKLRDSVLMSAQQALRAFESPDVAESLEQDLLFDATDFVRSHDTLFIVSPIDRQELFAPLIAGLLDDIARAAQGVLGGQEDRPRGERPCVLFALDEVANIAPLPSLPRLVSTGSGQGCQIVAVLQDFSQARARWPQQADEIGRAHV